MQHDLTEEIYLTEENGEIVISRRYPGYQDQELSRFGPYDPKALGRSLQILAEEAWKEGQSHARREYP